jgi:malyl-CoA/(S)-citramalyl-CoA lyase
LWTRINCLNSPWHLDEVATIVEKAGDKIDVIMVPKVEGPWDIFYMDQLLASLEAKHGVTRPILLHAILETAEGVMNVEQIAGASPRMQGISLGPADLAASRAMKTTRVGGGHPGYRVIEDPHADGVAPRLGAAGPVALHLRQDGRRLRRPRHQAVLRPVRGDRRPGRLRAAVPQRLPDGLRRGLEPAPQPDRHRQAVFSPAPDEVAFAKRILEAMPDGTGVAMLDGKMQDDATWKQAKVMVDCARQIAGKDAEYAGLYGF